MLKALWEVQSEREEREYMGYIDHEAPISRGLQTAYLNLEHTNEMLRADLRAANREIDRLKEYVVDLKHDLDAAIKECEEHHREAAR